MGADAPILPNTMSPPHRRTPPRRFECSFYKRHSQKTALPSEVLTRRPSDPIRGDTSGTKFDDVSNSSEITMNRFFFTVSDSFVNALYKKKSTGFFLLELPLADILSNFTGNI